MPRRISGEDAVLAGAAAAQLHGWHTCFRGGEREAERSADEGGGARARLSRHEVHRSLKLHSVRSRLRKFADSGESPPNCCEGVASPRRSISRAPPTFATEFGLDYTVTNLQYGFVAVGRWTVDHQNSSGSLNLRERTDSYNKTLQPRAEVKDYGNHVHYAWHDDGSQPCVQSPLNGTQPPWTIDPAALLIANRSATGEAVEVWRALYASISQCVDFSSVVRTRRARSRRCRTNCCTGATARARARPRRARCSRRTTRTPTSASPTSPPRSSSPTAVPARAAAAA